MQTKRCSKCGSIKELSSFGIHRKSTDGHMSECKECHNKRHHEYYYDNIEELRRRGRENQRRYTLKHPKPLKEKKPIKKKSVCDKEYFERNKDKIKAQRKLYVIKNKAKIAEYKKRHYAEHKESIRKYKRKYYEEHITQEKEKAKEYAIRNRIRNNKRQVSKMANDPQLRIAHNLRSRICHVLNGRSEGGRLSLLLGCSMEYFLKHIESQFTEGMNWSNYGKGDGHWSLDHIIPLALFNLED